MAKFQEVEVPEEVLEPIAAMPRAVLDGLGLGVLLIEAGDGRILFANRDCCRMLGYSEQELIGGLSLFDLAHPEDRERSRTEHCRLVAGEINRYRFDQRYLGKDGSVGWAHLTVTAMRDRDDHLRWCSAAIEDITAIRMREMQLADAQWTAGLTVWKVAVKSGRGEIAPNDTPSDRDPETSLLPSLDEFLLCVHVDDRETVEATIGRAVLRKAGFTHEYRIMQDAGAVRWLRAIATSVCDAAGEVTHLVGASIDITGSKTRQAPDMAPKPIRDILDNVETNWNKPLSIDDLARRYGVSRRYVFRYFASRGMTLARHIKQLRLRHARLKLSNPKPGTTVTRVAIECGFSNLGHFARDYSLAFGEKPSETLQTRR